MNWQPDWQDAAALIAISWAIWYVSRRLIGVLRRDGATGCGNCPGCAGKANHSRLSKKAFLSAESLYGTTSVSITASLSIDSNTKSPWR